jgi:uncharacterized metal-binding protein YceD (DUF177 family)
VKELFDWRVPLRDIGAKGHSGTRAATAEERQEMSRVLDITACEALSIDYEIKPGLAGHYRLTGRLLADVVQPCVVTLEPVAQHIDEALDVDLRPAESLPAAGDESESDILDGPDFGLIEDDAVNIGLIVLEHMSTAIDPYPRLPGAELEAAQSVAGRSANPFAVLKNLKDKA